MSFCMLRPEQWQQAGRRPLRASAHCAQRRSLAAQRCAAACHSGPAPSLVWPMAACMPASPTWACTTTAVSQRVPQPSLFGPSRSCHHAIAACTQQPILSVCARLRPTSCTIAVSWSHGHRACHGAMAAMAACSLQGRDFCSGVDWLRSPTARFGLCAYVCAYAYVHGPPMCNGMAPQT